MLSSEDSLSVELHNTSSNAKKSIGVVLSSLLIEFRSSSSEQVLTWYRSSDPILSFSPTLQSEISSEISSFLSDSLSVDMLSISP